jgi:hypothetical protein
MFGGKLVTVPLYEEIVGHAARFLIQSCLLLVSRCAHFRGGLSLARQ